MSSMPYVLILYYSRYGATKNMAEWIARGVNSIQGIEARIRTVPNVVSQTTEVASAVPAEGAPYVTHDDLRHCRGLALGSPSYFGNMAAPMKHFWDSTSGLWMKGALIDKPAAVFTSTSSLNGGLESTLISMMIPLLHHGMLIMGVPYSEPVLSHTSAGGAPYGPSHLDGDKGEFPLSSDDQTICLHLGKRLGRIGSNISSDTARG